jgi:predicted membrane-bound spermidine synthase
MISVKKILWLIRILFFVSGASALIDQMAWQRLLVLFAGGDVGAMTLIVAVFMFGLGLGNTLGGRLADRLSQRASGFAFAAAELLIGAIGASSAWFFHAVLYQRVALQIPSKFGVCCIVFLALLPPTLLMGLSLPLLAKVCIRRVPQAAAQIGTLYAVNTLGASCGAIVGVWLLLPLCGIAKTLHWAAFGNVVCALAGGAAFIKQRNQASSGEDFAREETAQAMTFQTGFLKCLAGFFFTGFAALSAEMVWLRVLGATAKASAQTMGTLLGLYLLGLGFGSLMMSAVVNRVANPWSVFWRLQGSATLYASASCAIALGAIQGIDFLDFLKTYLGSYEPIDTNRAAELLQHAWHGTGDPSEKHLAWIYPALHVILPAFVMLPSVFLMGAGFPLIQKVAQTDGRSLGRRTGTLQFANILGCIAGTFGVCAIIFPLWGSAGVFKLLACAGPTLLALGFSGRRKTIILVLGMVLPFLLPKQQTLWEWVHGGGQDPMILQEDASGVAALKRESSSQRATVYINGIGQSWIPFGGVHTLLGALPVLLHEKPERVALIGLGSGDTLYAMLSRPETRSAVSMEIIGGMPHVLDSAASLPDMQILRNLRDDPRVDWRCGDGRIEILRDPSGFDVIEADALRPSSASSGNLYSEEYFRLLAARLRPDGLAVSWLPTQRVAETMLKVFPNLTVFGGCIGVGTATPLRFDPKVFAARVSNPALIGYFQRAEIDLIPLLDAVLGPKAQIQQFSADFDRSRFHTWNTDLFPIDELGLPAIWGHGRSTGVQ